MVIILIILGIVGLLIYLSTRTGTKIQDYHYNNDRKTDTKTDPFIHPM
jgi:hypothetical protein